jgi:hypothetical protein
MVRAHGSNLYPHHLPKGTQMNPTPNTGLQTLSIEELNLIAGGGDLASFRAYNAKMAVANGLTLTDLVNAM